ncbi:MAG: L,D-transpeptidase family protein [Gemmatimonadaceae bacterium]|nr:L,D-transpeptidase family protein [Gemmatimonadaceae bacterium]
MPGGARAEGVPVAAVRADSVAASIERVIAARPILSGYASHRWRHVRALYGAEASARWLDGARVNARGSVLLDTIAAASAQALDVAEFPLAEIRNAIARLSSTPTADAIARADVLISAALVSYAEDLLTGQVEPRSVNREWHIDPQDVDVEKVILNTVAQPSLGEALGKLHPQDADYNALVRALARYRAIVKAGGWPTVPQLGVLRPGDTAAAGPLGALLARLHAEDYIDVRPLKPAVSDADAGAGVETPVVYDAELAGAVVEYQRRHALAADSVVGPETLASLNRSAEYRTQQIGANLERHRWLPRSLGARYVLVNVPAFRLRAYDAGQEVLTMGIVVGAEYGGRSTPVFSDSMAYLVFRPYWNVPAGIAAKELWPKQRRDPGYFARNRYESVKASWGRYVRQKPGPGNALGFVKFIFPNDFNIYLHDTPARSLFNERVRAFSHGCIRVQDPAALAQFVLGWDVARVKDAMDRGADDHRVRLDRKLPVYIVYFTVLERDGILEFANDIYDRDEKLVDAVRGAALATSEGLDERR